MRKFLLILAVVSFLFPGWDLTVGRFSQGFLEIVVLIGSFYLFLIQESSVNKTFGLFFLIVFLSGVWQWLLGNNDTNFVLVYFGTVLSYFFYYKVIQLNGAEICMNYYLKAVLIVCAVAVVQFVSFNFGFKPGYSFDWLFPHHRVSIEQGLLRVNAWFGEPSVIGQVLGPASFMALSRVVGIKSSNLSIFQSVLILFVYFISLSSLAFIGFIFSIFLILFRKLNLKRVVLTFVSIVLFGYLAVYFSPGFMNKINAFSDAIVGEIEPSLDKIDLSSFTVLNNWYVAKNNFFSHPFWGTGVGSHHIAYDKFSMTRTLPGFEVFNEYNYNDASSLFLRLTSETGLLGLVSLLYFLVINRRKFSYFVDKDLWLINSGSLILILVSLVRKGHYFYGGLPFFIFLYFFSNLKKGDCG